MASRELKVEIIGDAKSLQKALGSATDTSSRFGSSLAKMGKLAAVGLGAVAVGAVAAGKKMVSMASDAEEVDSKLNVVFGKTLPGLTKELDKFSEATGASRYELREQAADMGALLEPLTGTKKGAADMSAQFVKLATDLSSFNNVPVDDSLLAIRSGLVGEAEPLRRFGVLLNEAAVKAEAYSSGIAKTGAELTEQQKVQARANLIMQQTTLAQGDATRTSGSMANQLRALQNNLRDAATDMGKLLLPAVLSVVKAFNENWPQIEKVAKTVMAALVSGVGQGIQTVRTHFDTIKGFAVAAFDGVLSAVRTLVNFFKSDFGQTVGGAVLALLAFKGALGALGISIGQVGSALGLLGKSPFFALLLPLGLLVGELTSNFINQKIAAMQLDAAYRTVAGSAQALRDAQDRLKQAGISLEQSQINQKKAYEGVREAQDRVNQAFREYGPHSAQARQATTDLQSALLGARQADLDLTNAMKERTRAQQANTNELNKGANELFKLVGFANQANNTFAQSEVLEKFTTRTRAAGEEAAKTAAKLRDTAPAASAAQAKVALLADVAVDLAEKLGRVPSKKEIVAEAKMRGKQQVEGDIDSIIRKMEGADTSAGAAGEAIGASFGSGISSGIRSYIQPAIDAARTIIVAAEAAARAAAGNPHSPAPLTIPLGQSLVEGVIEGVKGYAGRLAQLFGADVKESVGIAKNIAAAAKEVGWTMALKAAEGFTQGTASLKSQIVAAAKQMVQEAKTTFATEMGDLMQAGIDAIAAKAAGWVPPSLLKLQAEQEARHRKELQDALKEGNDAVKAAQAELDAALGAAAALPPIHLGEVPTEEQAAAEQKVKDAQAKLVEAQKQQNAAKLAVHEQFLTDQAAKEQAAHDAKVQREQTNFANDMSRLQNQFAQHKISWREFQKELSQIIDKYGIRPAYNWGQRIAENLADGMRDMLDEVRAAAKELAEATRRPLETHSPAKEGPLSTLDKWWDTFIPTLLSGVDTRDLNRFAAGLGSQMQLGVVPGGTMAGAATATTGGILHVEVNVQGSVLSERELVDVVRKGIVEEGRRTGYNLLGGYA